jgi:regulatory protein
MKLWQKKSEAPQTTDEILYKIEKFCAFRERCTKEVVLKLRELNTPKDTIDIILNCITNDGFLNDERFAHAYANGKFQINHWGKIRIQLELRHRNIPEKIIQDALDSIPHNQYLHQLQTLIKKKTTQFQSDPQPRQKVVKALLQAGFEPELIFIHLQNGS